MPYVVCPERKGFPRINTQVCRICTVNCAVKRELKMIRYPKYFRKLLLFKEVTCVPKNEFTFLNLEGSEDDKGVE